MLLAAIDLLDTTGFPPRWQCGVWPEWLGWLHVVADVGTFAAYTAIPIVLAWFVLRRRDVPFPRVFWLFCLFIFACGSVHLIEAIIFWHPLYRLSGVVKGVTAIASWATVIALTFVMPRALRLPGLERLNQALRESEEKLASLLLRERKARADAEQASHVKDEFLSTVSHELRGPLNAILGHAQLLLLDHTGPDTREQLEVIARNAKSQARLIDDLIEVSRAAAGQVRLQAEPVDLVELVVSTVDSAKPMAQAKGIEITEDLPNTPVKAWGDTVRLQQVLWNLLTNALKFTPDGGHVRIAVREEAERLVLQVEDDGEGIAPDFLPEVFGRFTQASAPRGGRGAGLGIGLSIVRHLVELHGGEVEAASPGPGLGSTFTVRLPRQAKGLHEANALRAAGGEPRPGPGVAGLDVLVVDDEEDARQLIATMLERRGASVRAVGSGAAALEAIEEWAPDVLLSDIRMPGLDGYELLRAVRALPASLGGTVPAVALTAFSRPKDRAEAHLAGFHAHVAKPVDADELLAVLRTLTADSSDRHEEAS